jgi:hypothetical protein
MFCGSTVFELLGAAIQAIESRRIVAATVGWVVFFVAGDAAAVAYKATLLHPLSGYSDSGGYGAWAGKQAGYGTIGGVDHALIWSGTAASVVDLHPSGYAFSRAGSVSGSRQLGFGYISATNRFRALMWQGTSASVVNLHPAGFQDSFGYSVVGEYQIGFAVGSGVGEHAILWNGSASSFVDLHPAGYGHSNGYDLSGGFQVG